MRSLTRRIFPLVVMHFISIVRIASSVPIRARNPFACSRGTCKIATPTSLSVSSVVVLRCSNAARAISSSLEWNSISLMGRLDSNVEVIDDMSPFNDERV